MRAAPAFVNPACPSSDFGRPVDARRSPARGARRRRFDAFFDRFIHPVHAYFAARVESRAQASELTAEAMQRVIESPLWTISLRHDLPVAPLVLYTVKEVLREIDPDGLAKRITDFSGADIKAVFDQSIEVALSEAMKSGQIVPVTQKLLIQTAKRVKPSTRKWFESAKNYALYANQSGFYDDVLDYLGIKKS